MIRSAAISLRKFLLANGFMEDKTVVFDGSKMKTYASCDVLSKQYVSDRIKNIEQQPEKYLDNTEETDNLEGMLEKELHEKEGLKKEIAKLEMESIKEQMGIYPQEVIADKGYANVEDIKEISQDLQTVCYVPMPEPASKAKD